MYKWWLAALLAALPAGYFNNYYSSLKNRRAPSEFFPGIRGVVHYDRWRAQDGYNLVTNFVRPGNCRLLNMEGKTLRVFTGTFCHFLSGGRGVVGLLQGPIFMNKQLDIEWRRGEEDGYLQHHDSGIDEANETIYFLNNTYRQIRHRRTTINQIIEMSFKGERLFEWSVADHLEELEAILQRCLAIQFDDTIQEHIVTHLNSVQVLGPNVLEKRIPAFKRGNILTASDRHNLIFIIERSTGKIIWHYLINRQFDTGEHTTRLLENGHILYFANNRNPGAYRRNQAYSEVVEMDPETGATVWRYRADPPTSFYNPFWGSALRLENGNTLITHTFTGAGGAFEVTRDGRIVWEWIDPERDGKTGRPLPVFRVERIPKYMVDPYLNKNIFYVQ